MNEPNDIVDVDDQPQAHGHATTGEAEVSFVRLPI